MSENSEQKPRPTPRPRPGASARPSPRPRVAGSRRDREGDEAPRPAPAPRPRATARAAAPAAGGRTRTAVADPPRSRATKRSTRSTASAVRERRRGRSGVALALAVLCLLAAAAGGILLWQRLRPSHVDATVFSATRANIQDLYAFDYKSADKSVNGKLAVLTGSLRDQYAKDLKQGGIIDTYKQVSATTSYDVLDVGLQQINNAQDAATLVVFGQYVVKSANSANSQPPQGSECSVTPDGAQSCVQTIQVQTSKVDGAWKINQLTILTSS